MTVVSWDEALRSMPDETHAIRRSAFRLLQRGSPVPIDEVADAAGLTVDLARDAVELVASVGMAEIDQRAIVGMDGLTTRRTLHHVMLNGVELWTWCAYDIVGIAAALGADALGTTPCGLCGDQIEVVIRGGRPGLTDAVGWLPDESCSNVMAEFCPNALMFCSGSHLAEWRSTRAVGAGEALDVASLAARGHVTWDELVL